MLTIVEKMVSMPASVVINSIPPSFQGYLNFMQSYFHAKTDTLYVASRKQQRCMHCAYCDLYTVHARLTACFFHVGDVHIM